MNDAELSMMCSNWAEPDPDLEGSIMEILDGLVLHTSLDLEQHLHGWRLDSFDRIGGPGTLRGIWSKLKILKQVVGVKRKLTESLGSDDTSSTDKESIRNIDVFGGGPGGTCPPWDFLRDPSGPGFEVAGSNFYRKSILL